MPDVTLDQVTNAMKKSEQTQLQLAIAQAEHSENEAKIKVLGQSRKDAAEKSVLT